MKTQSKLNLNQIFIIVIGTLLTLIPLLSYAEGPVYNFNFYNNSTESEQKKEANEILKQVEQVQGEEIRPERTLLQEPATAPLSTGHTQVGQVPQDKKTFRFFAGYTTLSYEDPNWQDTDIETQFLEIGVGENVTPNSSFTLSYLSGTSEVNYLDYGYVYDDLWGGIISSYSSSYKKDRKIHGLGLGYDYVFNPDSLISFNMGMNARYMVERGNSGGNPLQQYAGTMAFGPRLKAGALFVAAKGELGAVGVRESGTTSFASPKLSYGASAQLGFKI